jgi:hypothetical protein
MTPAEAAALLGVAAAFDNRKPDADAAQAWSRTLDGLRFQDCRDAIIGHYKRTNDWLMPSHVIAEVKRIRHKRVMEFGPIDPPASLDPSDTGAYHDWLTATTKAIGDGDMAPAVPIDGPRRDVIRELGQIGREVPDA